MKKYIVALDQGTTSSRAIVFDHRENIISMAQKEFPQIYPQSGWVEHDPMEIYSGQFGVMMEAITRGGIRPEEIAAIGITNQRETTLVWEKTTGKPICNGFLMQFQADILDALVRRPRLSETTALGAACLAGLAVGFWQSTEELRALWQCDRSYAPNMSPEQRKTGKKNWAKAVGRSRQWEEV